MADTDPRKAQVTAALIARLFGAPRAVLCVGCGSGVEVGQLARLFGAGVVGVDWNGARLNPSTAFPGRLEQMDARELRFADESFHVVYSFHALEHIPSPRLALAEMARVLKPGGGFVVGTPNKSRVIGYLGSTVSARDKVRSNLDDWRHRVTGRWANEKGAHAGFTHRVLAEMCAAAFGDATDISRDYYAALYASHRRALIAMRMLRLEPLLFPAVYIAGRKSEVPPSAAAI